MELERGGEVCGEVGGIVAAGIEMEFVRDFAGGEDFVKSGGPGFEAVVVLVAAIEVDFQAGEMCGAGEGERAVGVPERGVGRDAENTAEKARARGLRGAQKVWEFFDECGAVSADGAEELRMAEGEMEGAVATHGNAGDGAIGAAGRNAITFFDEREKFLQQKVFVANLAVL